MTTPEIPTGRVRLFACGGGGINIGQQFEGNRGNHDAGFASIDPVYIDTSKSNLRAGINPGSIYLIEGLDGSGKLRRENHQVISERVRDMLNTFEPQDLNIVLSTGAGGSGSVIAPSLVSEMLDLGLPTIVVLVGSAESRIDAENTLKTIKSYEAVSRLRSAPVVVAYFENGEGWPRKRVDEAVVSLISALCALFSRQNRELDSQDLFNFLRFERVTSFHPGVAALSLVDSRSDLAQLGNVITVATLSASAEDTKFPVMPEYQAVGFVDPEASAGILQKLPLHYVTSDGVLPEVAKKLNDLLSQLSASQKQRTRASSTLSTTDNATDNGLVL